MKSAYFNEMYYETFKQTSQDASEALIMVHGFPGRREDKNRDLVFTDGPYDVYLPHHVGLGKSRGKFSFSESVDNFKKFYEFIHAIGYKKIHLVAHSWGGFISLTLMPEILKSNASILTFSPFLQIPSGEDLSNLTHLVYEENISFLEHMTEKEVLDDLSELSFKYNFSMFRSFLEKNTVRLKIIQAEHDVETPTDIARSFVKDLKNLQYVELDTDHSFASCREELKDLIGGYIHPLSI